MIIHVNPLLHFLLYWFWHPLKTSDALYEITYAIGSSGKLILAFDGWKIVGALNYYYKSDNTIRVAHLGSRKKGMGRALLDEVKKFNKVITLYCVDHNVAFYEKCGFRLLNKELGGNIMILCERRHGGSRLAVNED